jgi:hypothetical protein
MLLPILFLFLSIRLTRVSCWIPIREAGSLAPHRRHNLIVEVLHAQTWKLADLSNVLPEWATAPPVIHDPPIAQLTPENPSWTVTNPSPFWVAVAAQVVGSANDPASASSSSAYLDHHYDVSPVFGYLAPKGGTTNLCDEAERYQDFCEFKVTFPSARTSSPAYFLVIQTEDGDSWTLELLLSA